jgi:hypothetical protein
MHSKSNLVNFDIKEKPVNLFWESLTARGVKNFIFDRFLIYNHVTHVKIPDDTYGG